ncbi:MAG TPA: hypothetical protein VHX63_02430 [Acidobacteriaceae bacterium]|nr:hypothetical protein [Acidobacteriaceae bacterium]
MKKSFLIVTSLLLMSVTACTRLGPSKSYQVLGSTPAVVRAAFNADAGKVRVLMLVSPTCGVCLRGASEVSEQLVKLKNGKNVAEFVVWVPRLGASEKNVSSATQVVAASWAKQYWDGNDLLGAQYKQVLGWSDHAWDVYMIYGPKARWTGALPPTPDFFMHQTNEKGPRLDAAEFGFRVQQFQERH